MKTLALVNWASIERTLTQFRAIGRRRVPPPVAETQAIRADLTRVLGIVGEAQATLEKDGRG